jgi:DNA-binding transcriptional regulator GbsR (MarR family)
MASVLTETIERDIVRAKETVMAPCKRNNIRQFAEDFGIFFEKLGFPRMAGRIWGWLLTSDPPHQNAEQIAEGLDASRGSVSTMTRLLMQLGLIERVGLPGERSGFYGVRSGGFTAILQARMRVTTELRQVVEHGLEMLKDEPESARRHLEEYRDLCRFFEREFPALIEKWRREREGR